LLRRTLDNVTVVQISFQNFERAVMERLDEEELKEEDKEEVLSLQMAKDRISNSGNNS